jgi:hypothetical protein
VLKTLDVVIGLTVVLLIFSMAVTVITQALTSLVGRRGRHLKAGLADLLEQLGIPSREASEKIAESLLRHPMIAEGRRKLGTVIHREEFTKLLLDFASGSGPATLDTEHQAALKKVIADAGISDPGQTLKNVRAMALQLEVSNPELSNHMRDALALLHEASSDFVAKVNSWFDQTIDRVSQRFTHYTHWITMAVAVGVVVVVQLDIVAIADRLWIDDQFRSTIVTDATMDFSQKTATDKVDPRPYYDLLNNTALITLPLDANWVKRIADVRKIPGMFLAVLLISLGAPFWYNALKDLLRLRSVLAKKDDDQRAERQLAPPEAGTKPSAATGTGIPAPAWLKGERGEITAVG